MKGISTKGHNGFVYNNSGFVLSGDLNKSELCTNKNEYYE